MKRLVIYLGKKYIIASINDLLVKYKDNMSYIVQILTIWIKRLQIVIEELKNILSRVTDDYKIDDKDIKESVKEISDIIQNWK